VLGTALGGVALLLAIGSLVGLATGFAASFAASRLLAGIVYQANPSDPLVMIAVALTMAALGLLASALPARRALRVDPVVLLRDE
jgi:ABC-type antimicrobial peptide transport system permease subunit